MYALVPMTEVGLYFSTTARGNAMFSLEDYGGGGALHCSQTMAAPLSALCV